MRKPAKAKKTKRTTKRVKVTAKPVEKTKAATKFTPAAASTVTRSKAPLEIPCPHHSTEAQL